jgi:hypothetical protein
MDWNQALSGVATSFAWPMVVIAFILIARQPIIGLVARLEELTLPGGARAKFRQQLEDVRGKTEELVLATKTTPLRTNLPNVSSTDLELTNHFPEAAVLKSFQTIEQEILENRDLILDVDEPTSLSIVVRRLRELGYVEQRIYELFLSLQTARNEAVHGTVQRRITPGEALEYGQQAGFLVALLHQSFDAIRQLQAPPI